MRGVCALVFALVPPAAASAQQRVVSPSAETVAVTAYRNPERSIENDISLDWVGGYALITETRTVDLPAGISEVRFEGVADTLLPASVVVTGLPKLPDERNHDARLLSPGALIDALLGQQVHLRRTDRATGKVTETEALIRSGPNGVVLQTPQGFEALRCTGLPETLTYADVPADLSDKPTLAVTASAAAPTRATVRLSYLATQFDWQANYLARINADGRTLDLFAWLTLANGNNAGFPGAQAAVIAGEPNRSDEDDGRGARTVSPSLSLQCWPAGRTDQVASPASLYGAPPPPPPPASERDGSEEIIVTGARRMESLSPVVAITAQQENLGDLKLYRVPERVTIAANSQKQVALLSKARVPYERLYNLVLDGAGESEAPRGVAILLRMKNRRERGLGLPLPSGAVQVFETVDGRPMLAGEPRLNDKAVGEDVELSLGESPDVTYIQRELRRAPCNRSSCPRTFEVELGNARATAATIEVELRLWGAQRLVRPSRSATLKNGRAMWRVTVPANRRQTIAYTVETREPAEED